MKLYPLFFRAFFASLCVFISMMCAPLAAAQPMPPPPGGGMPFGGGIGGGIVGLPLGMLQLTENQMSQISTIEESYRDEIMQKLEAGRSSHQALIKAITGETFDESAVRVAYAQVAAADVEIAVLRAEIFSQIRPLLSTDQLAILAELIENGPGMHRRQRAASLM